MFLERIKARLSIRGDESLYRNPLAIESRDGKYIRDGSGRYLNFSSNDYLGLSSSSKLHESITAAFRDNEVSSSSSRLICGNYSLVSEAEKAYAEYFGYEDCLFFPSGYQANLALVSTIFEKGDCIFYDKHVHASLAKGIAMSGAEAHGFNHNNLMHLESRLAKHCMSKSALITESLFSMDGDTVDINRIDTIKKKNGLFVVIDEAHSFGVLGEKGKGIARQAADVATGTFGKALHLFGAFVLLPKIYKEYLLNFSSPVMYSTALPAAHAAAAIEILEVIMKCDVERERCLENSSRLKAQLKAQGFTVRGDAQIIIVDIGDAEKTMMVEKKLREKGIFLHAVRYPTVPVGKAMLRISVSALHDESDIQFLVKSLSEVYCDR